jgi:methylthioxylose transferase
VRSLPRRADLVALALAILVITATAVAGFLANRAGAPLFADAAPIFGFWYPHVGMGTPLALLVAIAVIAWGPSAALPWRALLAAGYLASLAWTLSLALVDGWRIGVVSRLTDWTEYLHDVPRVHDIGAMLATFTDHILAGQPDSWTVHVSGHPPGALLVYTWLDRVGLGGGAWAAVVTLLVGALVAVAVPVTARALGDEAAGRAVLPFAVLLPGAVWAGVSADGLFAGVTATGVALLAINRGRWWPAVAGGLLLGFGLFLSYGLTLMLPLVLVVLLATQDWRGLLFASLGTAAVVGAFAAAGFWWLDGYHLVVQRYHQGEIAQRPYAYWVFGNLGALLLSAGPFAVAALHRALRNRGALGWLVLAAAASVLAADLSGLSKAEVERIWLPFAVWFAVGGALLPRGHRWWLGAQAVTALAVVHLIALNW